MITFDPNLQKFQLVLGEDIAKRLLLLDRGGQPMRIVHSDPALLKDLEAEIMARYTVREREAQRSKKEELIRDWVSLPLLFILTIGLNYLEQQLHIPVTQLIIYVAVIGGMCYGLLFWILGKHKRVAPEIVLQEDLLLNAWIREHCG